MEVNLKYGKYGLKIKVPKTNNFKGIIYPEEPEKINNVEEQVSYSLSNPIATMPLSKLSMNKKNACIVISDITRPVPNKIILPPILKTLQESGIKRENIIILIATGIHRPNEGEELIQLVGEEIASNYKIINHFSKKDQDMEFVGYIFDKVPVYVNKIYLKSELKILTGFIEPHMWAGFSGGRKSILPGISSIKTLEFMHGPEMISHPKTRYGILDGNPFHEAGLEIMKKAGADFIVNVTLNSKKEITGIFSGDPVIAHYQGCEFLSKYCIRGLDEPLDFVITTNSGHPLDCNLYQSVKGIAGVYPVMKKGGVIIIATECLEGLGSDEYKKVLDLVDNPSNFLKRIKDKEFFIPDQWCAQETYQIMTNNPIWIYTEGIDEEVLKKYHFKPIKSIESAIYELLNIFGKDAHWAIVPEGPMVILRLAKKL